MKRTFSQVETKEELIKKLIDKLLFLKNKADNNNKFYLQDAINCPAAELKSKLKENGLLVINNAFTYSAFVAACNEAKAAFFTDIAPQLLDPKPTPDMNLFDITKSKDYWKAGIVGNKDLGYLFSQPESSKDMHSLKLSSGKTAKFAMGSGYKANIALLTNPDSETACDLLFSITGNTMVSQDSCKIHRGVDLTKMHVDIYSDVEKTINRHQAMAIGPNEGHIKMCFLRFSNNTEVQDLITSIVGIDIFDKSQGFKGGISEGDEVLIYECFRQAQCIQFADECSMVLWLPEVIHLEKSTDPQKPNTCKTERYIIGTQNTPNITDSDIIQIGYAADNGFFLHPYIKNNGFDSVHLKSTRFLRMRTQSEDEKNRFSAVKNAILSETDMIDDWLASTPKNKLRCYGIKF